LKDLNLNCRSKNNSKGKDPISTEGIPSNDNYIFDVSRSNSKQSSIWKAPESGWIKINVDASFVKGTASIACICRDHAGKVLWARNEANIKCQDVAEAEAKACLLGLQSAQSVNNSAIVLKSDSSVIVNAIIRRDQGHSRVWRIYEDIKTVQDSCLRFEIVKIGRESNNAAHMLADLARFAGQGQSWLEHVSPAVANIVENESVKLVDLVI
jgi:ribonuclease HI